MTRPQLAGSTRALLAGAICLTVLGGMLAGHAWPLWTGRDVLMAVTVDGTRTRAPGEYLQLSTPADMLMIGTPVPNAVVPRTAVRAIEPWVTADLTGPAAANRRVRGKTVYVQLEPRANGEHVPVSISLAPAGGAVNLRGIVTWWSSSGELRVQHGLDAFYMQEGRGRLVEQAFSNKRHVQMQVAIASSGRARIRNLLVDGAPVQ